MQKIGIMGGTFDPIHNGHLIAAQEVLQKLELDKIIFVPTGTPPLKDATKTTHAHHRHILCVLATLDNPNFSVSTIEIDREGTSYTIDTIEQLKNEYPNDELYFIVGADVVANFHKWRRFEDILQMCKIVTTTRPRSQLNIEENRIIALEISDIDISSTKIRELLAQGIMPRYLMPQSACDYIVKEQLYSYNQSFGHIKKDLQMQLSAERFAHTLSVVKEAESLGRYHFQDSEAIKKLRLAALLHDCAKNFCEERPFDIINSLCQENNVELGDFFSNAPELAHGLVGAAIAKSRYSIIDHDILDAITCHTFGKSNMTIFDKIVYIADFIEPTRPYSNVRKHAREIAYRNLDEAMIYILKFTIEKTAAKGLPMHPDSAAALKYLEENHG
ncbi:MAG: nicotinate-nucleotide adenylyltransferase [Defluviitaleaceae bacterium]|nr:nicotinate-nucleotide adenylyltransferase [Defluviitaleaceae bacterium]